MYICVWWYVVMWICTIHEAHVKVRGWPLVLVLTVHFVWDRVSCCCCLCQDSWPMSFWDSPVSVSHLAIEVLGLQMYTSLLGCVWALKIQTQVLRLDKHFTSRAFAQAWCFIFLYGFTLQVVQKCLDSRLKGMAVGFLISSRRNHTSCLFLNLSWLQLTNGRLDCS